MLLGTFSSHVFIPCKLLLPILTKQSSLLQVDNARTGIATHQVQEYSSALDEWQLKAPMITPRFRHDVTYAEGHVLSFGGASSSVCDESGQNCTLRPVATVEEYWDTDNPDIFVYLST